jgi:predicted amidohydrolase
VPRTLRLGALQLCAHDHREFDALYPSVIDRIGRAAHKHDLLVLPEGTFPAYVLGHSAVDERSVARAEADLRRIAREASCAIVAGAAVQRGNALYNSALVVDRDGTIAGSAEKIFLWHFDRQWFAPGESIEPVRTSIGMLGVLICADGRMPEIARTLVDRGADVLVMPTAWVTSGRDPTTLENLQADLLASVRAFENGAPFVAANKCGIEMGMVAYCGKSQIIDASGEMRALASQTAEEMVSSVVELRINKPYRATLPAPVHRVAASERTVRVAFSIAALPSDVDERLRILEADVALSAASDAGFAQLDREVPLARVEAQEAFDPGFLVQYRLAGYRAAILDAHASHAWLERIARARAAELRMYVIVFDRQAERAYAIDPDGAIVAGTFDGFTIASFALDPRRTSQTMVAPGTDVAAGLERVRSIARQENALS